MKRFVFDECQGTFQHAACRVVHTLIKPAVFVGKVLGICSCECHSPEVIKDKLEAVTGSSTDATHWFEVAVSDVETLFATREVWEGAAVDDETLVIRKVT